jgi:hypothetical protein
MEFRKSTPRIRSFAALITHANQVIRGPMNIELINVEVPTETRRFEKGRFDLYRVGTTTLGRATYEPGWRWSESRRADCGNRLMPDRTRRACPQRASDRADGRRHRAIDDGGRLLLRAAGSRQLGCRRRSVRLTTRSRQRTLRSTDRVEAQASRVLAPRAGTVLCREKLRDHLRDPIGALEHADVGRAGQDRQL